MAGGNRITLEGTVDSILFAAADNHYAVLRLDPGEGEELVTVVGDFFRPQIGEWVEVEGEWVEHRKFGRQIKVGRYKVLLPATVHGIQEYLARGNLPGVRKEMARRLVERFGEKTLEVIDLEPERLLEIEGIGKKRLKAIVEAWKEQSEVRETLIYFQGFGLTPRLALLIHQRYGGNAPKIVAENPYRLAWEVAGIGFKTADEIAAKIGITRDSPLRAEAGLLFAIAEAERAGHCYLPAEQLMVEAQKILGLELSSLAVPLETNLAARRLVREDAFPDSPVYHPALYRAEREVSERLRVLLSGPALFKEKTIERRQLQRSLGDSIDPTEEQKAAIELALANKVSVITGGPGVGKTTILKALVQIYAERDLPIHLAAPTGRAAKRLNESTLYPARTIHRLLGFVPNTARFEHDVGNPLDTVLVIIDEASMLDVRLAAHLLAAIPPDAGLVLIGDVDQLPSVGPGNVLRDIIESGVVPCARLATVFRQARHSLITENAHRINRGEFPQIPQMPEGDVSDFYFIKKERPEEVAETVVDLVTNRIPSRFGFDPISEIQVLSPMHRGETGTVRLNQLLQDSLNPKGDAEYETLAGRLRPGDKVMQTVNNYELDVFNGDIGRVVQIDPSTLDTVVEFDQGMRSYKRSQLGDLTLSYCVTVHKSQGSEYPAVVMPLLTQHYLLLQRNLLYTGITRGKRLVVVVGDPKALAMAIKNDRPHHRFARLRDRLRGPSS